jgi:hypothetical protein
MRGVSIDKQHNLDRCCILIMKLHVSVSNGRHQVSTPIKKILYICVGECCCRDLYASFPVSYCGMHIYIYIYISNRKRYFQNVVWTWILHLGAAQTLVTGCSLSYCHLSLWGPLVLVALEDVSCGGEKSVYENSCKLN